MKRQGGFTLIELVVVIVILGILAVTAAPKFLDIQGDARESALEGVKGAMQGAASMIYAKSALEGEEKTDYAATDGPSVVYDGTTIGTHNGYPLATEDNMNAILSLDGMEVVAGAADSDTVYVIFDDGANGTDADDVTTGACFASYVIDKDDTDVDEPTIAVTSTGC